MNINITKDIKKLCDICYQVGYLGAAIDKDWSNECADTICAYITDLFNAKRMYINILETSTLELIEKYKDAQKLVIDEYSTDFQKDKRKLEEEIEKYQKLINSKDER